MWLEVEYLPTSLFSFKDINATNTAATSLLIPTPFGVKMGLISCCIQEYSLEKAKELFKLIKKRTIMYRLPDEAVVNKTFGRINDLREKTGRSKPAYREYVFFRGKLKIAFEINGLNESWLGLLKELFVRINYFGKKGSFMQFKSFIQREKLDDSYLGLLEGEYIQNSLSESIIQQTEDIPPDASFNEINIYNNEENLKRKDNEQIFVVEIEQALSGEGYQYYKIAN